MARNPTKARDRQTLPEYRLTEHVVLECHCGKRLADLAESSPTYSRATSDHLGTTGHWFVRHHGAARSSFPERRREIEARALGKSTRERAGIAMQVTQFAGIADTANEDWHRVICPQCDRDHRFRELDAVALIRLACSLGARRISLARREHALDAYRNAVAAEELAEVAERNQCGNSLGL